jgi:hypothetical protein
MEIKKQNGIYKITDSLGLPTGALNIILIDEKTHHVDISSYHNLFVTVGRNSLAERLKGSLTAGIMTYCALGTGTNAPNAADTKLQTEVFRKLISVRSRTDNVARMETFYLTTEANYALKEAGLFGDDATATVDSGTIFCRTAINRTKTSAQTMIIQWDVTI